MRYFLISVILLTGSFSCTVKKNFSITSLRLADNHLLVLLDSTTAARTILKDPTDRFFDLVTASEMSIQIKKELAKGQTRADLLPVYQDYLRHDMESFTSAESAFCAEVLQEVYNTCKNVAPDIFPDTLILIKTKGRHYGESVYYTRENYIVIPENVLNAGMREAFTSTMYHELFHVYSRLNPQKRARLYRLIGFESIGLKNLDVPESLAARLLYNPDGVDFAQKITLKTPDGNTIDAIPVIYSNHLGYQAGKKAFFGYVEFNLFQVEKSAAGKWRVLTQPDGFSSTLDLKSQPDFFRQIKDNTGYIIHPDEVLADNFSFLMLSKNNAGTMARFSAEGKKLIEEIEKVIKN